MRVELVYGEAEIHFSTLEGTNDDLSELIKAMVTATVVLGGTGRIYEVNQTEVQL